MIHTRWICSFHVDLIHTRLPLLSHTATLHKISDSSKVSRVSEHLKRNNNVCLMPFPDMMLVLQTGHARYVILCFGSYFSVFLHTKNQCSSLSCKPGQNGQSSDKPGQNGQSSGKPGQWTVVRQTRTEWTVVRQTRTEWTVVRQTRTEWTFVRQTRTVEVVRQTRTEWTVVRQTRT